MAGSIAQETGTSASASAATVFKAFGSNNTAGNAIHVFATCDNSGSSTLSIVDTQGNSYGAQTDNVLNTNTNQRCVHWTAVNIGGGANTVTVTFSPAAAFRGIRIREIAGVKTTAIDGHHGNTQNGRTAGTDVVTSGAASNSNQPAFLSAFTLDCDVAETPTHGTGFADDGSDWDFGLGTNGMRAEHKAGVTSTGSQTATFTNSATSDFVTVLAIFDEATGTAYTASVTESGSAADSIASQLAAVASVAVAGTAAATYAAVLAAGAAISVAASAAVTFVSKLATTGSLSEAASAASTLAAQLSAANAVSEAGTANYTTSGAKPPSVVVSDGSYPGALIAGRFTSALIAGQFEVPATSGNFKSGRNSGQFESPATSGNFKSGRNRGRFGG